MALAIHPLTANGRPWNSSNADRENHVWVKTHGQFPPDLPMTVTSMHKSQWQQTYQIKSIHPNTIQFPSTHMEVYPQSSYRTHCSIPLNITGRTGKIWKWRKIQIFTYIFHSCIMKMHCHFSLHKLHYLQKIFRINSWNRQTVNCTIN